MASTSSSEKTTRLVLKNCYTSLKRDLSVEAVDELWSKDCIMDEEWSGIKSFKDHSDRNDELLRILMTKYEIIPESF